MAEVLSLSVESTKAQPYTSGCRRASAQQGIKKCWEEMASKSGSSHHTLWAPATFHKEAQDAWGSLGNTTKLTDETKLKYSFQAPRQQILFLGLSVLDLSFTSFPWKR